MPEVRATAPAPGPAEEALALWDDPARWPAFVDGFRSLVRVDRAWPAPGTTLVWDSTQHGPGHTREKSVAPGVRTIESEQLTGTLTAAWSDASMTVSLDYQLRERTPFALFFVRRALRDSLRRTVERYAIERRADVEMR